MPRDGEELVPVEPDPSSSLIIRKLVRSGLLEKIATWAAVALVGGGASVATARVSDSNGLASLGETQKAVAELKEEFARFRTAYYERQRQGRVESAAEHKELEREQRQAERYLERRLTRIESRLGIEAPAAPREQP